MANLKSDFIINKIEKKYDTVTTKRYIGVLFTTWKHLNLGFLTTHFAINSIRSQVKVWGNCDAAVTSQYFYI